MAGKKKSEQSADTQETAQSPSELDQLRDIVFGVAKSNLESDISALHKSMQESFAAAQENLDRQMKEMRELVADNVARLEERITQVDGQHDDKSAELNAYADKLSSELEMADANNRQENDELHARMDKELNDLNDMLNNRFKEVMEQLNQVAEELSSSKTDRKTLAKLLATMATNLESDEE